MIRYALLATIIAVVSTFCMVAVFKTYGIAISIASASFTAITTNFLWWRFRERSPTYHEKTVLTLVYGVLIASLLLGPVSQAQYNAIGLTIMFIYASVYPIFMANLFGERKNLNEQFQRAMIFCLVIGALLVIAMTFYHGFLKISEILG
ncbi:hypothetical protein [Methylophaga pinxianii]|uniref:hypothetical protein n=1 Tax=Methylophaga pinxianii TaxID=2881052 RepID=UPI001CF5E463|nr:hypothetical protein [Methylophaga pinxianii]MCB2426351.1 hypothetical protein [Methylophaga pinxianii]UPH46848.1 hypothetical protein LGT42_006055 [Methylophaga pinxianii]